jgi:hypothetical protein
MQEMAKDMRMWQAQGEQNSEIVRSEGRQSIFTIVAQRQKGLCAMNRDAVVWFGGHFLRTPNWTWGPVWALG